MKTKNILITVAVTVLVMTTSCKKSFFTEANKNPNAPGVVPPSTLLASVEGSLAYTQGGDMSRYASMFTQQTDGASRQAAAYYSYVITAQDLDNFWGNLYTGTMNNINALTQLADKGDPLGPYNYYGGVARLLMAYTLLMTCDMWGSIPYSTAFQGASDLHPTYDADVNIYNSVTALINKAMTQLRASSPGTQTPGTEDVIFGGDQNKWIKFAWALTARVDIHQSKTNTAMATAALAAVDSAFASNADNAVYTFGSTETSSNPWYQFNEQREDIDFTHSTLADSLISTSDPRLNPNYEVDTTYSDGFGSGLGAYYGSIGSVVELITYDEMQFIAAEANVRLDNGNAAQTAYTNGITASMNKFGISSFAGYLTAKGTLSGTSATALNQIAYQEWVALYLNPEEWTTWRRIGYPNLVPVGNNSNGVARRLLYPQSEIFYNGANVPGGSTLWSPKIFWDK